MKTNQVYFVNKFGEGMNCSLVDRACSYVPVKALVDNPGCFEATHNRSALEADTGDRIVETLLSLMQELSEKTDT